MRSKRLRFRLGVFLVLSASQAGAEIMCLSSKKANVREGAGTEYPVAWVADQYTPFKVLSWDGEWVNVKDVDGDAGWAHQSVLSSDPCVIVAGKRANVRSGAGLEHEVLWEVERGYPFKVLRRQGDWLQVTDGDKVEGWIFKKLMWGNTQLEESEEY